MTEITRSYLKVAYDVRPAKQVERRMMLDAFGRLMSGGVPIREYQYTGLGSTYFYDFILFYRLLGLKRLTSVEIDTRITKRIAFNRPFAPVVVRMEPIGDVIPTLDRDRAHIIWLDYDNHLQRSMLSDAAAAAYHLSTGSVVLITVDAEDAPGVEDPSARHEYLLEEGGEYLPPGFDLRWCSPTRMPETILAVLGNAIRSGVAPREVKFHQLFKFRYADSHEMVTIGGIIGDESWGRRLDGCDWVGAPYLRRSMGESAYAIRVPKATLRERLFLDQRMPREAGWSPDLFEMEEADLAAYHEIHRFYPYYGELFS